jgi:hypothetical protein
MAPASSSSSIVATGSSSSVPVHWICSYGDIIVFRVHVWFRGSPRYCCCAAAESFHSLLLLLLMLLLLVYLLSLSRCISVRSAPSFRHPTRVF